MTSLAHSHAEPNALDERRLGGLAAMVAGPLFLAAVAVLTLVELDFMHGLGWRFTGDDEVPWPSGLAMGDVGALQVLNFALAGTLLAVFARGFRRELPRSRSGRVAAVLVTTVAGALMLSAFPTDRATAATGTPDTWHGYIHIIGFVVLAIAALAAPVATGIALRGNPRWRRLSTLSVGVGVLEFVILFPLDSLGDPAFVAWMVVLFGWFAALGAHLLRLTDEHAGEFADHPL